MSDRRIVDFHVPGIHDILPDREASTVIVILLDDGTILQFRFLLSPFPQLKVWRLHHQVGNNATEETDQKSRRILMSLGKKTSPRRIEPHLYLFEVALQFQARRESGIASLHAPWQDILEGDTLGRRRYFLGLRFLLLDVDVLVCHIFSRCVLWVRDRSSSAGAARSVWPRRYPGRGR